GSDVAVEVGIEAAVEIASVQQFESWMAAHHATERELWAAIFKKSSKRQTVTFEQLLEVALCWGWVDVMTKGIDAVRYGIRFVPRKMGSTWSPTNRRIVCRLIAEGRMRPSGAALLPSDLVCD
ncbi:MAG: hypothetical protein IT336_13850, partial [Thermomicrobiales bacterium]|nr:hypothetical protein [Thermomicrobiales bacterium]